MYNTAFTHAIADLFVKSIVSSLFKERYKTGKQGQNEALGPIPPRFWQEETSAEVSKGRKNLFIYLNAYSPDRDGEFSRSSTVSSATHTKHTQ